MTATITALVLKILVVLLPWLVEAVFSRNARKERKNADFDKALAGNDTDAITRMLSQRFDRVR